MTHVFILSHNQAIETKLPKGNFTPLFCGNREMKLSTSYAKDDRGTSISFLYDYYGFLTGHYWAWKNTQIEILGFCHYDKFFMKNKLSKLNMKHIDKLFEGDIDFILPEKSILNESVFKTGVKRCKVDNHYPHSKEWTRMRYIIKDLAPDYLNAYDLIVNENNLYQNNIFISHRNILNEYYHFMYKILEKMRNRIEYDYYKINNPQVAPYLAEVLLTTFIRKNELNVKELAIKNIENGEKNE